VTPRHTQKTARFPRRAVERTPGEKLEGERKSDVRGEKKAKSHSGGWSVNKNLRKKNQKGGVIGSQGWEHSQDQIKGEVWFKGNVGT